MQNEWSRTEMLLGTPAMEQLKASRVAVFGVGGVGSFAAEALVRAGIGAIDLIDSDRIHLSNINRQLHATHATIGRVKVEVMQERMLDINPNCKVTVYPLFYDAESAGRFDLTQFDYIVDAIDTVPSKLLLIENAYKAGVRIVSSMGAGNKLDPARFEVADLYQTSVCPLARAMRRELRARGIPALKVVYSREEALTSLTRAEGAEAGEEVAPHRQPPGSVPFVPPVAGYLLAAETVKDLTAGLPRVLRPNDAKEE